MTDEEARTNMDSLIANSDFLIASPETIAAMQAKGMPVTSKTITYDDYIANVFEKRKAGAMERITKVPHLHPDIASGMASALFEELKETVVFGITGASITLACILLDLACKERLFKELLKKDPETKWEVVEKKLFSQSITGLYDVGVFDEKTRDQMLKFGTEVRNNYVHYNVLRLIRGMVLAELPIFNVETGEIHIERDVKVEERHALWFSAKRKVDKVRWEKYIRFCVETTNTLYLVEI